MKRRMYIIIGISAIAVVLVVGLICGIFRENGGFNGFGVCSPNRYMLDFSYMNRSDEHTLYLRSDDILKVTYEIESGRTDVVIGISGQEPIYRGNDIQTGSFELYIGETGDYIISVDAEKASGRIEFSAEREYST